jgi:hypothetical protein
MTTQESLDRAKQAVAEAAEGIANAWRSLEHYEVPPPGVIGEVVISKMDLTARYKTFESLIGNELTRLQQRLMQQHGIDGCRELTMGSKSATSQGAHRINEVLPDWAKAHAALGVAIYRANLYGLRYVACGEKSRLGEAVLQCYPRCGIPCGWDEREGVVKLYQNRELHERT